MEMYEGFDPLEELKIDEGVLRALLWLYKAVLEEKGDVPPHIESEVRNFFGGIAKKYGIEVLEDGNYDTVGMGEKILYEMNRRVRPELLQEDRVISELYGKYAEPENHEVV